MKQRPGRARRRGPSLGEKFGRFKSDIEARVRALESGHVALAKVSTEILEHQVAQANTLKRIEEKTTIFADAVAHIDNFIKGVAGNKKEGGR